MGLDVYVGSLTRYYSRQWENKVQKWARETGTPVRVVRQDDSPPPDAAAIEPAARAWRDTLSEALAEHGIPALSWEESLKAPYFTDRPAWDCYSALLVWAAHADNPDVPLPETAPEDWRQDPAYRAVEESRSIRYPHLLRRTEFWLPADFEFTFAAEDLTGTQAFFGSSAGLLRELGELNRHTWRATPAHLADWREAGSQAGAPLETAARFALAVFLPLCQKAVTNNLPMKLDY
jgi:hypothetical protein